MTEPHRPTSLRSRRTGSSGDHATLTSMNHKVPNTAFRHELSNSIQGEAFAHTIEIDLKILKLKLNGLIGLIEYHVFAPHAHFRIVQFPVGGHTSGALKEPPYFGERP